MNELAHVGKLKPVAVPCDEEDEAGAGVRTWDVVYRGRVVESGHRTRREARAAAAAYGARLCACGSLLAHFSHSLASLAAPTRAYCDDCGWSGIWVAS